MSEFYFVIDTDTYAGNFERSMCAYITGVIGECAVGKKFADIAHKELGNDVKIFDNIIDSEPDEHGCHRPVKIYSTPGFYNNGLGFEYQDGEEELARKAYREHCIEESKKKYYIDDESNLAHEQEWMDSASKCEIGKYPSYQSVAIVLCEKPTDHVMNIMCDRAKEFVAKCRESNDEVWKMQSGPDNIIGFRIVEEKTVVIETKIDR